MKGSVVLCIMLLFALSGCSELVYNPDRPAERFLQDRAVEVPESVARFSTCQHYGCNGTSQVTLTPQQWQQVVALFLPPATSAEAERQQIATAIGQLETFIGTQNNTFADQACNAFKPPLLSFQLDCVAETANTTTYLLLMEKQQLLQWHRVSHPTDRGLSLHYTAVIQQSDSAELYAVDSWFHANGEAAEVVPLATWRDGYEPLSCP